MTGRAKRPLQIGTAVLIGLIALSAYGGVVGLVLDRADRQTFESTTSRQAEKSAIVRAPTSHHSPLARVDDRASRGRDRTRRNPQARTSDGAQPESEQG